MAVFLLDLSLIALSGVSECSDLLPVLKEEEVLPDWLDAQFGFGVDCSSLGSGPRANNYLIVSKTA